MAEKNALSKSADELKQEKTQLETQMESLKTEAEQVKQQLAAKSEEATNIQVEFGRLKAMHSMTNNKNEKLKKEIALLQQQIQSNTTASATPLQTSDNNSPQTTSPVINNNISSPTPNDANTPANSNSELPALKRKREDEPESQTPKQ
ncbi:hypothetical protein BJ944DRAFT_15852 [Cunninghamella echinulata]|nr:hypothetical protein BJ944DRAFT_15852 [Cunninghamella echinulata]